MTKYEGEAGWVESIKISDLPRNEATLQLWLMNCPGQTPAWDQFLMMVLSLAHREGYPPPNLQFPGATHELIVAALDPSYPKYSVHSARTHIIMGRNFNLLRPFNVVLQFEMTDQEACMIGELLADGVAGGHLAAEPPLSQEAHQERWLTSITKTLAHMRGEEHAP